MVAGFYMLSTFDVSTTNQTAIEASSPISVRELPLRQTAYVAAGRGRAVAAEK